MFDLKMYAKALAAVPERYLLVNAMVHRMRQLQGGAEPMVESEGLSLFDISLKEIVEGKIAIKHIVEERQTLTLNAEHLD